jgi:lysophospholipid acyltransferase (LPLAT)-like uncharacterized protein
VKIKSPTAIGAWSLAATACIRQWMHTLDYKVDFADPTVDPVHDAYRGVKIYVFWHENILFPLHLRGHCNISMLLSRHLDANILDRVARMNGFGVVRGSTFRGGAVALRELAERAAASNLTITPDGPRGPRRQLAAGCVFLASTLGIPIVEALFSCAPVITTVGGVFPEAGGPGSLYVNPDDTDAFSEALRRVLDDTILRENMSRTGREYARRFEDAHVARALADVYEEAMR